MALIRAGQTPLERLAVTGSFAVGVYLAISKNDPVLRRRAVRLPACSLMRVSGPLMQLAQLVNQFDEARAAVALVAALVNQPKEEGAATHGVQNARLSGRIEFFNLRFKYQGATSPCARWGDLRSADRPDPRRRRTQRLRQDHRRRGCCSGCIRTTKA